MEEANTVLWSIILKLKINKFKKEKLPLPLKMLHSKRREKHKKKSQLKVTNNPAKERYF